jgi:hypothetical protein
VKNKKLFERSEFFLFSGEKCRSRQKVQTANFFVSFLCSGKEMKSLRGLSESEAL